MLWRSFRMRYLGPDRQQQNARLFRSAHRHPASPRRKDRDGVARPEVDLKLPPLQTSDTRRH